MKILVLNAGSSSYKLAIYAIDNHPPKEAPHPIWKAEAGWNGYEINLKATYASSVVADESFRLMDRHKLLKHLLDNALKCNAISSLSEINAIGHRIVHGGDIFLKPVVINAKVKKSIEELSILAPLHNPSNLEGINIAESFMPGILQVAVFDTAFHHTLSEAASTYPGPYSWKSHHIKRYGFHGISHQYCSERCTAMLNARHDTLRIVSCHLGNGSSLAAIHNGKSIDTTMGFTPVEGMMMGTRCGSIDPSIVLFLQQQLHHSPEALLHTLNNESGLKGISGASNDMRDILQLALQGNTRALLAYDMYVHSLKRNIGAMIAVLGGVDAIVFTAGIGENVASIRSEACAAFSQWGIELDKEKNEHCRPDAIISTEKSQTAVLLIKTQEDWCIARSCWEFLEDFKQVR